MRYQAGIGNEAAHYFQDLSAKMRQEPLSPDQITSLTKAVAALGENSEITSTGIDRLANQMRLTQPHRATLIFSLLVHRHPELRAHLPDPRGMAAGLSGILDRLLELSQAPGDVSRALEKFHASFAGNAADREASGLELFPQQAPSISIAQDKKTIEASIMTGNFEKLDDATVEKFGAKRDEYRRIMPQNVTARLVGEGEDRWYLMVGEHETAVSDLSTAALTQLANGLAAYVAERARQHGAQPTPEQAIAIAKDVRRVSELLEAVTELAAHKRDVVTQKRAEVEGALRKSLEKMKVARIGEQAADAFVAGLFPKEVRQ